MVIIARDNVAPGERPAVGSVAVVASSTLLICVMWAVLLADGGASLEELIAISGKFKVLGEGNEWIVPVLIGLSACFMALFSVVILRAPRTLVLLLLFSFGFSDVAIPALNASAFVIRYSIIFSLVAAGGCSLIKGGLRRIEGIQWIGIAFLVWCFANVAVNGPRIESLTMLPMQVFLIVGMLFGCREIYRSPRMIESAFEMFAGMGMLMTIIHAMAIVLYPDAFLKGRFTSIFLLPTGFANNYVLFWSAMLWRAFRGGRASISIANVLCLIIGAVLLILSGTRNAMLAMGIVLLVFMFIWRMRAVLLVAVGVLVGGVMLGVSFLDPESYSELGSRASNAESYRVREQVWTVAWTHIQQRPFIGYGMGVGAEVLGSKLPSWFRYNTHNAYLGMWLQLGMLGLVCVVGMYLSAMTNAVRACAGKGVSKRISVLVALPLATLCGLFVGGFFEENLTSRGSLQQAIWAFDLSLIQAVVAWKNASMTS